MIIYDTISFKHLLKQLTYPTRFGSFAAIPPLALAITTELPLFPFVDLLSLQAVNRNKKTWQRAS